jgi:hypothetical protein
VNPNPAKGTVYERPQNRSALDRDQGQNWLYCPHRFTTRKQILGKEKVKKR